MLAFGFAKGIGSIIGRGSAALRRSALLLCGVCATIFSAELFASIDECSSITRVFHHFYDVELPKSWGNLALTSLSSGDDSNPDHHVILCIGNEWKRFPSSFYLQHWSRARFFEGKRYSSGEWHVHGFAEAGNATYHPSKKFTTVGFGKI